MHRPSFSTNEGFLHMLSYQQVCKYTYMYKDVLFLAHLYNLLNTCEELSARMFAKEYDTSLAFNELMYNQQ